MSLLSELVEISREVGADPSLVLAGGGNTSVKEGDRLWVKASGAGLKTITEDGFALLDRVRLSDIARSAAEGRFPEEPSQREAAFKEAILSARLEPEKGQRPSVEALLHHLMDARFVVHTHPTIVNGLTCCTRGEELARELFGDAVLWLPYCDPGVTLATAFYKAIEERGVCPRVVLMANHGMIVGGDTLDEVRQRLSDVIATIESNTPKATEPFGPVGLVTEENKQVLVNSIAPALRGMAPIVVFSDNTEANPRHAERSEGSLRPKRSRSTPARFVHTDARMGAFRAPLSVPQSQSLEILCARGPLTPDQIVYCDSFPMVFAPREGADVVTDLQKGVSAHREKTGSVPKVVIVKGLGIFTLGDTWSAADTTRAVFEDAVQVMARATALGGISHLEGRNREFIERWEAEAYRKNVAKGQSARGRAAGKVALVTGSAQGIGLGIARDLVEQGAHVVMADINEYLCQTEAGLLCDEHGSGRAMGIPIDVTDAASVESAVALVVREFGGLDLVISNAGILRAGSVTEQSPEEFERVTKVNYLGYFHVVRAVAPVMAIQRRANPEWWGDIIQINSKSGLVGSNRNFAYAGSKFGGIGLTQSFALELVSLGIKVNAICPGNFFEGPLWSDPENGLFAQYLREGKAPGAKTVDDVRRFYEAKVPMGRGVTVADIMRAVYYLVEQEYETGQALPVTGGQVMLH